MSSSAKCVYCGQTGGKHKAECVAVKRTVVVEVALLIPIEVPRFWGKDQIEFWANDGSYCLSNFVDDINKQNERFDKNDACFCPLGKIRFVRELKEADVEDFKIRD